MGESERKVTPPSLPRLRPVPPSSMLEQLFPCTTTASSAVSDLLSHRPLFTLFLSSHHTSFSPIRFSGHILCSFPQVSRRHCFRGSVPAHASSLTSLQLWSHYQSRTSQKFDIYDSVSTRHPLHFHFHPCRAFAAGRVAGRPAPSAALAQHSPSPSPSTSPEGALSFVSPLFATFSPNFAVGLGSYKVSPNRRQSTVFFLHFNPLARPRVFARRLLQEHPDICRSAPGPQAPALSGPRNLRCAINSLSEAILPAPTPKCPATRATTIPVPPPQVTRASQ